MKIFLQSMAIGCTASLYEVAVYRKALEKRGHESVGTIGEADIVVINTCAFTGDTEAASLNTIAEVKSKYPEKKLVVGGCLPKINAKALQTSYQDMAFHPEKIDELLEAIGIGDKPLSEIEAQEVCDETHNLDPVDFNNLNFKFRFFYFCQTLYFDLFGKLKLRNKFMDNHFKSATVNHTKYLIQTARGCLGKCTYCSIKKSRGKLISTPLEQIKKEVDLARTKGAQEIVLVGEDIGAWGQDIGSDVSKLLNTVSAYLEGQEIIIPFFEPMWMIKYFDHLRPIFASGKFISLYIPFQSGSDRVLKRMGREYSTKTLSPLIKLLKKDCPDMVTKTHLLHSFPGETWPEFYSSIIAGFEYDFVAAFPYSPRPGTMAANFTDQIHPYDKKIRTLLASVIFTSWNIFCSLRGSIRSKINEMLKT